MYLTPQLQCRCIGLDNDMPDAPASDTENYIAVDSKFPPVLWSKPPDLLFPYTNNGAESYHSHLNAEFYVKHRTIYVFVDVLKKTEQTALCFHNFLYITKMRFHHQTAHRSRLC